MDLKIIEKKLNKENIKMLKDALSKINPNIGKKLISWVLQHPRYLKSFFPLYRAYTKARQVREKELENGLQETLPLARYQILLPITLPTLLYGKDWPTPSLKRCVRANTYWKPKVCPVFCLLIPRKSPPWRN